MSKKFDWLGKSGSSYSYHVHELPWRPSEGQDGNYIFAKLVNRVWHAVYIGQGDLKSRYDAAQREGCVTEKRATHYHVHLNDDEADRKAEEKDLIAGNPECKSPIGCNGRD